jgi:hypothetical protein
MGPLHATTLGWSSPLGTWSIALTVVALVALAALHVVSPELDPSWRMVSEYANGRYAWLLQLFFASWGAGTWLLAAGLSPLSDTTLGKVGLAFLFLAGLGEIMAAFFDINHRMHGPAAMIGIPSLPIAAVLISVAINRRAGAGVVPMWTAHLTWVSVVLMAVAMGVFMSALSRAGVNLGAQAGPLRELPEGVRAFSGWANRLLVVSYGVWVIVLGRVVGKS